MFNKIKENTFIKSTFILLFGGILGKMVGFIIRIIITRMLSTRTIGLYSLLSPTTALLTTIGIFSYSNAISKFISEKSSKSNELILSIIPLSIIINIFFILFTILFGKILATNLLHESSLYIPIVCISLTMPFVSISAILKGYFWAIQNYSPYMLSNFIEQILRLVLIILFLNNIDNDIYKLSFIILINILGEISSWIVMLLYIPKKIYKNIKLNFNFNEIIKTLKYCIPATGSKIIGSISYFLEPIILTNILLYVGYTKDFITFEYGVINAYSLSLLLMAQFFTQNMSVSLIPELSKNYKNNKMLCKRRIKQIICVSLLIGLTSTIIITIFPEFFLKLLFNTNKGVDYIRLLSPFIVLFYIESPLINAISAIGDTKEIFKITTKVSIIRIISIIIFSLFKIGIYSLVITIIINICISTFLYYKKINSLL